MAEEIVVKRSLDILDQINTMIADFKATNNRAPKRIELGSMAYRRFAIHLASVRNTVNFKEIPVSLNWGIDTEDIVLRG